MSRVRRIAAERDSKVIDQKREEAQAAAALAAPVMDVVGGDEFDTLMVDTPESRE
jgi:DNA-directed RNA polymerase subunit beta'